MKNPIPGCRTAKEAAIHKLGEYIAKCGYPSTEVGRPRYWYNAHGLFISATIRNHGSISLGPFSKGFNPHS